MLPNIKGCEKRNSLLAAYQRAVKHYSAAVGTLQKARGITSQADYETMYIDVEQSRQTAEEARIDLERHTREHGCLEIP